jgi:hypothetical protein
MKTKICTQCKKRKLFRNFTLNKKYTDGYNEVCMICIEETSKQKSIKLREKENGIEIPLNRICYKCKEIKPLNDNYFNRHRSKAFGFTDLCKVCRNTKRYQQWRERNSTVEGKCYSLYEYSKARASKRKKDLDFDLDLQFIIELWNKQSGCCALTGIPFTLLPGTNTGHNPLNASLDRIDSTKGYIRSNVRMVCTMVNLALNNFGEEKFKELAVAYIKHNNIEIK